MFASFAVEVPSQARIVLLAHVLELSEPGRLRPTRVSVRLALKMRCLLKRRRRELRT